MKNKTYQIRHDWKHVQGHIATTKFFKTVEAECEENAILKFKEEVPDIGQYIKKDTEENYWFYGTKSVFTTKDENIVYAICLT